MNNSIPFKVNLYHDGLFTVNPFSYEKGDFKVIDNVDYDGMLYVQMYDQIRRLVLVSPTLMLYKLVNEPLLSLKPLQTDEDVMSFVKAMSENDSEIDLYCEHNGYDIMEIIKDELQPKVKIAFNVNPDDLPHAYYENLDDLKDSVEFDVEGEDSVKIARDTTVDPWLNKLVGVGSFIGQNDDDTGGRKVEIDPEDDIVDYKCKAKPTKCYPCFDPSTPWDECKPILGMKFESPQQLKNMLANYGVSNGYQLWYEQNDHSKLLVNCGRNVSEGKCASHKGKKPKIKVVDGQTDNADVPECSSKPAKVKKKSVSENLKETWNEKKEYEKKRMQNTVKCPFRLWASWMSSEKSFQIKSLYPDHKCCRNYTLGSLVTYKWIAHHYARDIIDNPHLSHRYMQNSIKEKFLINVSLGQCKRAKACCIYDHEGGLVEHYSKLWDYRQAVLDSNPGSSCVLETEDREDGKDYFKRIYVCFKGVKQGWLDACRKVIGLDGCFLTHTCKGQLLTAIGRDANNQMYPIAWAVVGVENKDNWAWFLSLLGEDLQLGYGEGLTVISDGHKGLIEAVAGILPDSEHRQCARHIYANFKRKWHGLEYKRLFWYAASATIDQQFYLVMDQIKEIDPEAHKWLVERNPNSWCRAFFELDRCTAAFENGISEAFNSRIVPARGKPLITLLEEIRMYVMQRLCHMKKVSFKRQDPLTPSVRKRLECLKQKQRSWVVYPSGYKEVEVRKGDYAFGVNLHTKQCGCRFWQLSGIPCVHAMAAYYHMSMEPELGVNNFLSKQSWHNAYQYSIKPVPGSKLWKKVDKPAPFPPIERKKPGRPKKQRIRHPTEDDYHVSRVGRVMHCHTCWEVGHNKKGCPNGPRPKPSNLNTPLNDEPVVSNPVNSVPNSKGKGIDLGNSKGKGIDLGNSSGTKRGNTTEPIGASKKRGTIRIGSPIKRGEDNPLPEPDNLIAEEHQYQMDVEALHEVAREIEQEEKEHQRMLAEQEANDLYWENMEKEFQDHELDRPEDSLEGAYSFDTIADFQDDELNVHQVSMDLPANEAPVQCSTDESQSHVADPIPTQESQVKKTSKIRKKVAANTSLRIYVKNRGRSERIAKMKAKNFKFDANGTGSTADKAFDVSEDEE